MRGGPLGGDGDLVLTEVEPDELDVLVQEPVEDAEAATHHQHATRREPLQHLQHRLVAEVDVEAVVPVLAPFDLQSAQLLECGDLHQMNTSSQYRTIVSGRNASIDASMAEGSW